MKIKDNWSIIQTERVNKYNENNSHKIKIMAIAITVNFFISLIAV